MTEVSLFEEQNGEEASNDDNEATHHLIDAGRHKSKGYEHDSRAEEVQESRTSQNERIICRFEIYFLS